ncbi:hypothetical protein ACKI14_02550 [Streptomyces turgidiscabies]|uniref:hypothetical protein n=1 Tax=Streptomyces turgidiscabies TaxID=85558 RepID=UPI0038F730BD
MGDTFGGQWNRPGENNRKVKDRQQGKSQRQLQDRAGFDHEPQLGCGAMFLLCIAILAAVLGIAFT